MKSRNYKAVACIPDMYKTIGILENAPSGESYKAPEFHILAPTAKQACLAMAALHQEFTNRGIDKKHLKVRVLPNRGALYQEYPQELAIIYGTVENPESCNATILARLPPHIIYRDLKIPAPIATGLHAYAKAMIECATIPMNCKEYK